jgi:hypothetical protein
MSFSLGVWVQVASEPLPFGENGVARGAGGFAGNLLEGAQRMKLGESHSKARKGQSPRTFLFFTSSVCFSYALATVTTSPRQ